MRLEVIVKPNARKTEITGKRGDAILVSVAAPPENNKANIELLKFLRKQYGPCEIVSGFASKKKLIKIY